MKHPLYDVIAFEHIADYTLRVIFDDHTAQTINFEPVLYGELFGPLRAPEVFMQVRLDPETHTLVWSNGADFDPWTLHDWPTFASVLSAQAQKWRAQ
jgi:hypothetical protein